MSFDDAAVRALFNAVESHLLTLGLFDQVNVHEPKNAPGNSLTCAVWVDFIGPVRESGLASTSATVVFMARVYSNMLQDPADSIDPNMLAAVTTVIGAFSGDFEMVDPTTGAHLVREVDLLGSTGRQLSAQAGYVNLSNTLYRIMTITIPMTVNDAWTQVA